MIAIPEGINPTVIAVPVAFVAVLIGVTVLLPLLATYTVFPSGVIASWTGKWPTAIAAPAMFVAVSIGDTVSLSTLAT